MEALLGAEAGANFHSWAVWGSRKAGVTIRQEDLDQARRDGTAVGGFVGGLVGMGCGWLLSFPVLLLPAAALLGLGCGVAAGRYVISRSRRISAQLILGGNRTVLEDIGMQTVRFIRQFGSLQKIQSSDLELFLADIPAGRSGSPNLLRYAFTQYFEALTVLTPAEKQRAT
ncbi:hypothetical protein [Solirubrum puertoriconensis]|uniref:Uncharacterized protein n=1 Tax=Solirubrum puertoriconensis TaxID=1751427 RepID=A0A9X0L4G3_SOLP1|nr:hypothetical protein [Solirubrum puertoriconensis]KUG07402.1 hypothetical protein ASU33_13700 [Solirubrum puertoriconensis]